jgi:hypothetical protein
MVLYGLVIKILSSHLWKGGTPSLNIIAIKDNKENKDQEEPLKHNLNKIKEIEAKLWETKYFKQISEEKKDRSEFNTGKIEIMLISKPTHKKNIVLEDRVIKILKPKSTQKPSKGVKNIIKP